MHSLSGWFSSCRHSCRLIVQQLSTTSATAVCCHGHLCTSVHVQGPPQSDTQSLQLHLGEDEDDGKPCGLLKYSMHTCKMTCHNWLQSIRRAHANIKPGKLRINSGELLDANANRSPSAYLHNPEDERARYQHNTDKIMTQLSVTNPEGKGEGNGNMVPQVCRHVHDVMSARQVYLMVQRMETPHLMMHFLGHFCFNTCRCFCWPVLRFQRFSTVSCTIIPPFQFFCYVYQLACCQTAVPFAPFPSVCTFFFCFAVCCC